MSAEILDQLIENLCVEVGVGDPASIVAARMLDVSGFECSFEIPEVDPDALYLLFNFGIATAQRTLRLFSAMLEANLTTYAQDQAQMGLDSDTGSVLLIVRLPGLNQIDPAWLAETLLHYAQHGLYWRDNIFQAEDEMFAALCEGEYQWIRV